MPKLGAHRLPPGRKPVMRRKLREPVEVIDLEGEGIFSDARDWVAKKLPAWLAPSKSGYTKSASATLARLGSQRVERLTVFRKPIASGLETAINWMSAGKFDDVKRRMGYEKMFHLGTVATLADGSQVIVEKLQTINIAPGGVPAGAETRAAPIDRHPTLFDLLERTRASMGDALFFGYQALPLDGKPANNCQVFVDELLRANGALTSDIRSFVVQDVAAFAAAISPGVRDAMQLATDAAATAQHLVGMGRRRTALEALIDDII